MPPLWHANCDHRIWHLLCAQATIIHQIPYNSIPCKVISTAPVGSEWTSSSFSLQAFASRPSLSHFLLSSIIRSRPACPHNHRYCRTFSICITLCNFRPSLHNLFYLAGWRWSSNLRISSGLCTPCYDGLLIFLSKPVDWFFGPNTLLSELE